MDRHPGRTCVQDALTRGGLGSTQPFEDRSDERDTDKRSSFAVEGDIETCRRHQLQQEERDADHGHTRKTPGGMIFSRRLHAATSRIFANRFPHPYTNETWLVSRDTMRVRNVNRCDISRTNNPRSL